MALPRKPVEPVTSTHLPAKNACVVLMPGIVPQRLSVGRRQMCRRGRDGDTSMSKRVHLANLNGVGDERQSSRRADGQLGPCKGVRSCADCRVDDKTFRTIMLYQ